MNGAPLTKHHGFPARALVPGWIGAASCKWLTEINVLENEFVGNFMSPAYRFPNQPVRPGDAVKPEDTHPLTGLSVKSVYGCFPDYKLPRHLVPLEEVNSFLLKWEIDWEEHHGDRGEALGDQNAIRSAYRQLADNGIAQWFCPSYVMILVKS